MAECIGSGVNVQGGSFALLLPLGYGLVVSAWLAPTPALDALRWLLRSLVRTTATVGQKRNLGELRLLTIVLIRTVYGTMAVLLGTVVAVVVIRNFAGVFIGTWYILAERSWSA